LKERELSVVVLRGFNQCRSFLPEGKVSLFKKKGEQNTMPLLVYDLARQI